MDCPHLSDGVKIDRLFVRNKIRSEFNELDKRNSPDSTTASDSVSVRKGQLGKCSWKCLECASEKENWMCLHCGKILCGRYVNSHALKHSAAPLDSHHKLCMNTLNQSVYCYKCNDYVINETVQLDELRAELQTTAGEDEEQQQQQQQLNPPTEAAPSQQQSTTATTEDVTMAVNKSPTPRQSSSTSSCSSSSNSTTTTGDSGCGWAEDVVMPQTMARRLRPRKRTISSDSNNQENSSASSSSSPSVVLHTAATPPAAVKENSTPAKRAKSAATKRVVGLRNLGNTCFMNSVLQSLSNIQEFSSYFASLPTMEQIKAQRKSSAKSSSSSYVSSSSGSNASSSSSSSLSSSTVGHSMNGGILLSHKELEDVNVVEELRKVLLSLGQGGDGSKAISPECLFQVIWKVVPQFRGHRQHDAHEFLRYMLDRLHTELQQIAWPSPMTVNSPAGKVGGANGLNSIQATGSPSSSSLNGGGTDSVYGGSSKRGSIVSNVFGGVLQSEVRCLICGMESKKHDPFLDLSLDIPEKFYGKEAAAASKEREKEKESQDGEEKPPPACHILDCLSSFTEVEELAETELYYCNSCKCKQKSTKRFWIRRLPNVLCLHIKRFRWSNFFRTKIDLRISFPITSLDMSQFVLNNGPETRRSNSSNNVYDLAAVIVHHGNGSSCGHYTSYAYNSGTWLHFNDHTVKEVPISTVVDCKPYILFYTRRDMHKSTSPSSTSSS